MTSFSPLLDRDLPSSNFATSPTQTIVAPTYTSGNQDTVNASESRTSSLKPQKAAIASNLNSRSCVLCRKRKVKCDKRQPCGNCNKAGVECSFPAGRAPRRIRKPQDTELLARLKKLEGLVQSWGKGGDEGNERSSSTYAVDETDEEVCIKSERKQSSGCLNGGSRGAYDPKNPDQRDDQSNGIVKEFGRLIVDEGRSRSVKCGIHLGPYCSLELQCWFKADSFTPDTSVTDSGQA